MKKILRLVAFSLCLILFLSTSAYSRIVSLRMQWAHEPDDATGYVIFYYKNADGPYTVATVADPTVREIVTEPIDLPGGTLDFYISALYVDDNLDSDPYQYKNRGKPRIILID